MNLQRTSVLACLIYATAAIYNARTVTGADAKDAIGVVKYRTTVTGEYSYGSGIVLGNGKCMLTAAHVANGHECDMVIYKNQLSGSAGAETVTYTDQFVGATYVDAHPRWKNCDDPTRPENYCAFDLAVVQLNEFLSASPWNVSLTRGGYTDQIRLFGWGQTSNWTVPKEYPIALQMGEINNTNLENDNCTPWRSGDGAICLTSDEASEGLNCGGDSGGPGVTLTTVDGNARVTVMGVASEKYGNCGNQMSGVLAAVAGSSQKNFLDYYANFCGWHYIKYDEPDPPTVGLNQLQYPLLWVH